MTPPLVRVPTSPSDTARATQWPTRSIRCRSRSSGARFSLWSANPAPARTTVGMAMLKLLPDEADVLAGRDPVRRARPPHDEESELRTVRGRQITMIFQDPIAGLNPVLNVGDQVAEVMTTHMGLGKNAAKARSVEILAQVGLPDPRRVAKSYPFQLSGGMCQRVMIGIATAMKPGPDRRRRAYGLPRRHRSSADPPPTRPASPGARDSDSADHARPRRPSPNSRTRSA